jgi:DNA-directed RNA polymerase subunit E'/Rpb7
MQTQLENPYINTKLYSTVMLTPSELNNELYINIKKKLKTNLLNKCFGNYGYISNIYELFEYKNGYLHPENLASTVLFNVSFSCKICKPLINQTIIAKVDVINRVFIRLNNGPLTIVITTDRINDKKFFMDKNYNVLYSNKENKTSQLLKEHQFVKVTLLTIKMNDGDNRIICIGYLEDIASDVEIEQHFKDNYNSDNNNFINYEDYIADNKKKEEDIANNKNDKKE